MRKIDRFTIEDQPLAFGRGDAAVYAGTEDMGQGDAGQPETRPVAVKLFPAIPADDSGLRDAFFAEAKTMMDLSKYGRGFVRLHARGVTEDEGRPWIAMQLCEGSLADRLDQLGDDGADPADIVEMLYAIGEALALMHGQEAQPITHRDLKPGNVLIDPAGGYLLGDFGLTSAVANRGGLDATSARYLAPEMATDLDAAEPASDLYALGHLAYEMALGGQRRRAVFAESLGIAPDDFTTNRWVTWHADMDTTVLPLDQIRDGFPAPLARVIEKLMAKDRAMRYNHINAVFADLDAAGYSPRQAAKEASTLGMTVDLEEPPKPERVDVNDAPDSTDATPPPQKAPVAEPATSAAPSASSTSREPRARGPVHQLPGQAAAAPEPDAAEAEKSRDRKRLLLAVALVLPLVLAWAAWELIPRDTPIPQMGVPANHRLAFDVQQSTAWLEIPVVHWVDGYEPVLTFRSGNITIESPASFTESRAPYTAPPRQDSFESPPMPNLITASFVNPSLWDRVQNDNEPLDRLIHEADANRSGERVRATFASRDDPGSRPGFVVAQVRLPDDTDKYLGTLTIRPESKTPNVNSAAVASYEVVVQRRRPTTGMVEVTLDPPLSGVTVGASIAGTRPMTAVTDAQGVALILNVPEGRFDVSAQPESFMPAVTRGVEVRAGFDAERVSLRLFAAELPVRFRVVPPDAELVVRNPERSDEWEVRLDEQGRGELELPEGQYAWFAQPPGAGTNEVFFGSDGQFALERGVRSEAIRIDLPRKPVVIPPTPEPTIPELDPRAVWTAQRLEQLQTLSDRELEKLVLQAVPLEQITVRREPLREGYARLILTGAVAGEAELRQLRANLEGTEARVDATGIVADPDGLERAIGAHLAEHDLSRLSVKIERPESSTQPTPADPEAAPAPAPPAKPARVLIQFRPQSGKLTADQARAIAERFVLDARTVSVLAY